MIKPRENIKDIPEYIAGRSIESIKKQYGLAKIVKMASNENPLGSAIKDISSLASELNQYYPDEDSVLLKEKLANKYNVQKENIILGGNGSDEILLMLVLAFIDPGNEIVTADCTFSGYKLFSGYQGAKLIKVALKENRYDLEVIAEKITARTKLIFIANPNSPTGTIVTKEELDIFLQSVPKSVIVVLDEAYSEYVQSNEYPNSVEYVKEYENVLVLHTFSKIYGLAGFRIGYGIGSKEVISILAKVKPPFSVGRMALKAAELALDNTLHFNKSIVNNEEGKQYLYKELTKLGLVFEKTEANFIYIELPVKANDVCDGLIKEGIIVRDCSSFGRPEAIRVTIGLPDENRQFIQGLGRELGK